MAGSAAVALAAMRLFAALNARGVIATTAAERQAHVAALSGDEDARAVVRGLQATDAFDLSRLAALRGHVLPPHSERRIRRLVSRGDSSSGGVIGVSEESAAACDATVESCMVACATLLSQCAGDGDGECAALARSLIAGQ